MNTHVLKDLIDNYVFDSLDNLESLVTDNKMSCEKCIDCLHDMHDEIRELGYTPCGFQERYEQVYFLAYDKIHGTDLSHKNFDEDEEEEEYALLFDSKDGYSCPWFNDENTDGIQEVRFYPDRDSRLYILKDGTEYWTD